MNEDSDYLSELEHLNAALSQIENEEAAVWVLHRMSRIVLELIQNYRQCADLSEGRALSQTLIPAFQEYYEAYCTLDERKYQRACKVWWSLTEAMLHTVSDDPDGLVLLFWFSLRWISFSPEKRDLMETD